MLILRNFRKKFEFEAPPPHNQPTCFFSIVKGTDNIYYCTINQGRVLRVGGDIVILPWNERTNIIIISPPTHKPQT